MAVVGYIDGYVDENNNEHGLTDTVAQGLITAIKDGSSIDSFGDVETALADKPNKANVIANTQLIADTVGFSGKNKFNPSAISLNEQYVTLNPDGSSIEVKVTTAQTYRSTSWIMPVERNTDYIISSIVDFVSGGGYVLVKTPDDSANIWASAQFTSDGEINALFNSGANDSVLIKMFCTLATSEVGDVIYKNFMIRKADILDATYEPYHGTTAVDWASYAKTGVHNILDPDFNAPSFSGVDDIVTLNNGILTLNGTRASSANYAIKDRKTGAKVIYLPKGKYTFYALGADWENGAQVGTTYNNTFVPIAQSGSANDRVTFTVDDNTPSDYKLADGSVLMGLYVKILAGTYSNKIIKPMLCLGSDTDDTYARFAKTNEQLTDAVTVKTIAHATAITEGDLSVTFTEYITGNIVQIIGNAVSSTDKDASSQTGISLGTILAHKPLAYTVGNINSSLSSSDRKPICSITMTNTGRMQVDGQMVANRSFPFTITYIFND